MSFWAPFRLALRALAVNTLRSILTMLGIVIGVAAVITMIAVGGGATERVQEQMKGLGSNIKTVLPACTAIWAMPRPMAPAPTRPTVVKVRFMAGIIT